MPLPLPLQRIGTTPDGRPDYGPSVRDGELLRTSPSQILTADSCLQKWWFEQIRGVRSGESEGTREGTAGHRRIEEYYTTGKETRGRHEQAGLVFFPEPGDDLLIEHDLTADGVLECAGVPIVGYLDLAHRRGLYVTPQGDINKDPPNTLECVDWKFTSDLKWVQRPDDVKMHAYAEWAFRKFPDLEWVRLSLVYFQRRKRAAAEKTTMLARRCDIAKRWDRAAQIVRNMIAAAAVDTPQHVEGNPAACDQYEGCPAKDFCPTFARKQTQQFFGENTMTDLTALLSPAANDAMAQLAANDGIPPGFADAITFLESAGFGMPQIGGDAAAAFAKFKGQPAAHGYAGHGQLAATKPLTTVDEVIALATAVRSHVNKSAPPTATPPDAPPSQPALAADPVPGDVPPAVVPANEALKAAATSTAPLPAAAAPSDDGDGDDGDDTPSGDLFVDPKSLKVKQLRALVGELQTALRAGGGSGSGSGDAGDAPAAMSGLVVLVDCRSSMETKSLDPYVDALCDALQKQAGVIDLRAAPNDNAALGYGRWKGALAALVKAKPPTDGAYHFDTYGDELRGIVAEALRHVSATYVRGR